jgi:hypothetical protein
MANVCRICKSGNLKEINSRLIKGEQLRNIAEDYGMAESSVFRHKRDHLPKTLMKAFDKLNENNGLELAKEQIEMEHIEIADSLDAIKSLNFVVIELKEILEATKTVKMHGLSIKTLAELRNTYAVLVSLLEKAESAYQAKLELLKLERREESIEAQRIAAEKLKIPTFDELQVHLRIINKMLYDNGDVIIKDGKVIPSIRDIENIHHE